MPNAIGQKDERVLNPHNRCCSRNAGTRTLTVNVYEQAFAISNLGAGAAVAVVIFVFLLLFSIIFIRFSPKDAG